MINELNVKIYDYIFSSNIGLRGNYLEDNNENNLCSELSKLIMEVCDEYDFWNEYKYFFNDNCVIDASTLGGHHYVYNGFPKMKLGMKKEYLNYKLQQVKNSINNNGEFLKEDFEKITSNIINVAKKEILDYCAEIGIIEYVGNAFIAADNCPALAIIYDNIKAVLYTETEIKSSIAENVIVINGNGNNVSHIEQNANSKNNDEELFNMVLSKLDMLEKEGVSKSDIKLLSEACKQKNKNKVIEFLKEVSSGTISSLIATGILAKFGIQ